MIIFFVSTPMLETAILTFLNPFRGDRIVSNMAPQGSIRSRWQNAVCMQVLRLILCKTLCDNDWALLQCGNRVRQLTALGRGFPEGYKGRNADGSSSSYWLITMDITADPCLSAFGLRSGISRRFNRFAMWELTTRDIRRMVFPTSLHGESIFRNISYIS